MASDLTVIDLFCGGGGFSEGFRQAGFEVVQAVDFAEGACETYALNAPDETTVENADLLELDPESLPNDIDVLIGSPPCKEFSSAKNGGSGDIQKGMELVDRFLYFVHELEPEYWIMENVPRLDKYLTEYRGASPGEIPLLDEDERIHIPRRERFDCDEYGTPQRRTRLFSGDFPDPIKVEKSPPTFEAVRCAFPRPTGEYVDTEKVQDPLDRYDVELPLGRLSDHFYNTHLTKRETREIAVRKEDHSFYGRMSFPDDKDKTSRTVVATNRRIARETLVMEEDEPPDTMSSLSVYRKPTLRELATIQGFPITYQFTGNTLAQKRRRIGDAVPPTMAYQLALGIRCKEGDDISAIEPEVDEELSELDYDLSDEDTTPRKRRKLSLSRSFRHHVPYDDMRKRRVDLETTDATLRHPLSEFVEGELPHPVCFQVVFYRGYAKTVEKEVVSFDRALEYLAEFTRMYDEHNRVERFLNTLVEDLGPDIPDATTLQAIRSRRMDVDEPVEYDLLERIAAKDSDERGIVDEYFPRSEYEDVDFEVEILDGTDLPARTLMKMVAVHFVAHKLNHCSRWISEHPDRTYLPDDVTLDLDDVSGTPECVSNTPACGCIEETLGRLVREWQRDGVGGEAGFAD